MKFRAQTGQVARPDRRRQWRNALICWRAGRVTVVTPPNDAIARTVVSIASRKALRKLPAAAIRAETRNHVTSNRTTLHAGPTSPVPTCASTPPPGPVSSSTSPPRAERAEQGRNVRRREPRHQRVRTEGHSGGSVGAKLAVPKDCSPVGRNSAG